MISSRQAEYEAVVSMNVASGEVTSKRSFKMDSGAKCAGTLRNES